MSDTTQESDESIAARRIEATNASLATARARFFTARDGRPATEEQIEIVKTLQEHVVGLAATIELLVPPGRNRSLALTALEDVQMRANRGIFAPSDIA